jgi:hypothetical protein
MGQKIARMRVELDESLQYFIKDGDIWARPRWQHGQSKGKAHKVANVGILMEEGYLYYVDGDGDVACTDLAEQLDTIRMAVLQSDALAVAVSRGFEYEISSEISRVQLQRLGHLINAAAQAAATAADVVDKFCVMMAERASLNSDSHLSEDDNPILSQIPKPSPHTSSSLSVRTSCQG